MVRRAGAYPIVGYGENIDVPTSDLISNELIVRAVGCISINKSAVPSAVAA